jgi:hypothetical protein
MAFDYEPFDGRAKESYTREGMKLKEPPAPLRDWQIRTELERRVNLIPDAVRICLYHKLFGKAKDLILRMENLNSLLIQFEHLTAGEGEHD